MARIFHGLAESPSSRLNVAPLGGENLTIIFTFNTVTLSARVGVSCTISALNLIHCLLMKNTHRYLRPSQGPEMEEPEQKRPGSCPGVAYGSAGIDK